eukprot:CAMPEP_0116903778 /NCGR_PEP_ID=MMETSP0467-20121206/10964_1 /TAXON_ID=283647 /ORGANISM="Mesodinium pulex, Strain SPMC105" /LENGTH=35 /DNA_ID= /DNA_START= /DNA_END= /DNA_ORIENTATION=
MEKFYNIDKGLVEKILLYLESENFNTLEYKRNATD